jgi:hypothetical protein
MTDGGVGTPIPSGPDDGWCSPWTISVVYYESLKRAIKTKTIYGYRCDERLKTNVEESTRLACTPLSVDPSVSVHRGGNLSPQTKKKAVPQGLGRPLHGAPLIKYWTTHPGSFFHTLINGA